MSGPTPQVQNHPVETATPANHRRARTLLIVFSTLLALWIAGMIVMYVTTVYPERYPGTKPGPTTHAPGAGN